MNQKTIEYKSSVILWIFGVFFFIYQYGIRSVILNVLNGDLQRYFSIGATEMGQLVSLFFFAYMIAQIPVGILIDRFNLKSTLTVAFLCAAIGIIAFVSVDNYFVASLSQLFLGFGCSFSLVLLLKISDNFFPPQKSALASSIGVSFGSLGPVFLSPLLAALSKIYHWRNIVLGFGVLGIISAIVGYWTVYEKKLNPASVAKTYEKDSRQTKNYYGVLDSLKIIFSNVQFIWIGLFSMAIFGPASSFCDVWGISFVKQIYGIDAVKAASIVSLTYLGTILGIPLATFLSEKLQSYKKVMVYGSSITFI
ncbi:MAG: MFS transporter, partial [Holosporaceae bacterium]|nr:MFS transporter [Holosporaceae bacterium]